MLKNVLVVTGTTVVVGSLAYFLGFPMLFAHTAFEVVWYGLLFGIPNILAVGIANFFGRNKTVKTVTEKETTKDLVTA